MSTKRTLAGLLVAGLLASMGASTSGAATARTTKATDVSKGASTGRYFVQLESPAVAEQDPRSPAAQRSALTAALDSQLTTLRAVEALGGRVVYRYGRLLNGFSAEMTADAAKVVAARPEVASVGPVSIVHRATSSAVPFIGAPKVWRQLGAEGEGTKVAVIDTGVDYLHADFGGPGTEEAYENNDPLHIERGTFPTNKVIGGYDFVGEDYEPDPLEGDPSNDVPRPDPDPLDIQGHGSHVSGICCGVGVGNRIGKGVAPKAKILALKVFALGSTTGDVIAAAMERAIDPNGDGSFADAVDVINMSLGSDYGTILSPDIVATERAIAIGVTVVAASGNAGNQPAGGVAYITGAPGVSEGSISVAASIDEFRALKLSPTAPSNVTLPNEGLSAHQDWSAPPSAALTGDVVDVRVAQTTTFGATPVPEDRYLCDSTPSGRPFEGKIALVYKGSTDAGDCDGTEKVFRAQEAGAVAVILWSGFGDIPFALGPGLFVDDITVPAVMVSTSDGQALADADSPGAPDSYDTGGLTVSLPAEEGLFPAFVDRIADFSSEGPAGLTDILKPDISAPGFNITSASVGTGNGDLTISGTSMSTPMVAGVAAILKELHPNFPPIKIKALIMNQATRSVRDSFGIAPVSATVMGAGRIRAFDSASTKMVAWPPSISYGARYATDSETLFGSFNLQNFATKKRTYEVAANVRYSDYQANIANVRVALPGGDFVDELPVRLGAGDRQKIRVRLRLDPNQIDAGEQELGWVGFHANVDGVVTVRETGPGEESDALGVPWHVVPVPTSDVSASDTALDLTSGQDSFELVSSPAAGLTQADAYVLGVGDDLDSHGAEDVTHIGARSFTGAGIGDGPEGIPGGTDPLLGATYTQFFATDTEPSEPIEFAVRTEGLHSTTDPVDVRVFVDVGADGVFADPELKADYLIEKQASLVCVFDLSKPDALTEGCSAVFNQDYDLFNTNVFGLVVDAASIGVQTGTAFSYGVEVCDTSYEIPQCDTAGSLDESTGTYPAKLTPTDPPLVVAPFVCGGFFATECTTITVSRGAPGPADLLMLYPNNRAARSAEVITTQ